MINNPKNRQAWVYQHLSDDKNIGFSELFSKYSELFSKSEKTFSKDWNIAKAEQLEYQKKVNKAKLDASISQECKAAEMGIKTRQDRVVQLQKEIEKMEAQLRGDVEFNFMVGNSIKKSHSPYGIFMLPVQVQNELRREIRAHRSEISKIEGDYAPSKVATTDKDGNDLPQQPILQLPAGSYIALPNDTE